MNFLVTCFWNDLVTFVLPASICGIVFQRLEKCFSSLGIRTTRNKNTDATTTTTATVKCFWNFQELSSWKKYLQLTATYYFEIILTDYQDQMTNGLPLGTFLLIITTFWFLVFSLDEMIYCQGHIIEKHYWSNYSKLYYLVILETLHQPCNLTRMPPNHLARKSILTTTG